MSKMKSILALALLYYGLSLRLSLAGALDDLEATVAFLKAQVAVTETVNGEAFEVWLKHPKLGLTLRKTFEVTGSGFFVATERIAYLITAKHVATSMNPDCEVTVRGATRKPVILRLHELIGTNNAHLTWIHHPELDLSIHPIEIGAPRIIEIMRNHALPIGMLRTNSNSPSRDIILTTLGFPLGMGVQSEFSPISQESKASSGFLDEGKFGYFLMKDPSMSGFSGAPLFEPGDPKVIASSPNNLAIVSGGTGCWGLVSATIGDVTGGKMAKIVPSRYIVEMIKQFEGTVTFINPVATAPPSQTAK